jgi:hypothetical protein
MAGDVVVVGTTEYVLAGRTRVTMLAESWRPLQMSPSVLRAVKGAAEVFEGSK